MDRKASSLGDIENGLLKSNAQHTIRERGSSKSLDERFFAKVLGNLLPFDGSNSCDKKPTKPNQEQEKIPSLKTQSSNGDRENQKMGIIVENYENNYEKRKKSASGKASKPPKPPRHPSFDAAAADKKLVKEIAELARRERARIERLKLAKKKNTPNSSSSSSSSSSSVLVLFAMFVSLLFFVIVIFQAYVHNGRNFTVGLSTRSMASSNLEGSAEHYNGFVGFGYHLIN